MKFLDETSYFAHFPALEEHTPFILCFEATCNLFPGIFSFFFSWLFLEEDVYRSTRYTPLNRDLVECVYEKRRHLSTLSADFTKLSSFIFSD